MSKTRNKKEKGNSSEDSTVTSEPPSHKVAHLVIPLDDDPDAPGEFKLSGFLQYVDPRSGMTLRQVPLRTPHKGPPPALPIPSNRYRYDSFVVDDFAAWPKLQWMVEGLFHVGSLVMVWGASGAGKTAWLIELVISIAMGKAWIGGRKVEQSHILFCAMEGAQGFRERVMAAVSHHQFVPERELRFIFESVDLTDPDRINGLAAIADRYSIKLIVIDTLAAALAGKVDENSNQQMAAVIDHAKRLSQMTGATVLMTHHTGHDTRNERGATALRGGVDTSISINRRDKRRYWRVVKQRDGGEGFGGYFDLQPHQFNGPDGTLVKSVILQPEEEFTAEAGPLGKRKAGENSTQLTTNRRPKLTENQQLVLDKFRALWAQCVAKGNASDPTSYTIPLNEALAHCTTALSTPAEPKRRTERTKEALKALVTMGLLEQLVDKSFRVK